MGVSEAVAVGNVGVRGIGDIVGTGGGGDGGRRAIRSSESAGEHIAGFPGVLLRLLFSGFLDYQYTL